MQWKQPAKTWKSAKNDYKQLHLLFLCVCGKFASLAVSKKILQPLFELQRINLVRGRELLISWKIPLI